MQDNIITEKNNIYILTGKIRSGKTTFLFDKLDSDKNAAGILTLTRNKKRLLYDLAKKEYITFEVDDSFEGKIQKIGRFNFDDKAFEYVEAVIDETDFSSLSFFILDEAGPLELNQKGFFNAVKKLLVKANLFTVSVIIVVREECALQIIDLFEIKNPSLIRKERWDSVFYTGMSDEQE